MTFESRRARIPSPDLDDRTWQDLVDQMRALIPTYASSWTDHNHSDLGITLIELFAWLVEGLIYRLNQVPDKNYLAFLDLLGITRNPATPAHTYLKFTADPSAVRVPAGTQAQAPAGEGKRPVAFETDEDVTVLPTTLTAALSIGPYPAGATSGQYDNVSATLIGPPTAEHLVQLPPGQTVQLCLGFGRPVTEEIALGLRLRLPARPVAPTITCVYAKDKIEPLTWPKIEHVTDTTEALQRDGSVRLNVPGDWAAQRAAGPPPTKPWTTVTPRDSAGAISDPLFWIGLRIANPSATPLAVSINRLLFNTAAAQTALTIREPEILGQSTGAPFQVFELRNRPLFRGSAIDAPYAHLSVQVGTGTPPTWQDWTLADDFPPGPGRVYRADPVTGEIEFGNHDERTGKGFGSIPPAGSLIRARAYRYVDAGAAGNVPPAQVTVLGTALSGAQPTGITGVVNLGPGLDGVDEEPVEQTLRRAPEELKIRGRAVTAQDYEFLVGEAASNLPIRRCLTPRFNERDDPGPPPLLWQKGDPWIFAGIVRAPGTVNVIIVPDQPEPRPQPTAEQIGQVRAYVDSRRDLTAHLEVHGPRYLPVSVNIEIKVWQEAKTAGANLAKLEADTRERVIAFLHPTRGGPADAGWRIGQAVLASDLFRAITPPEDLGYISKLTVKADIPIYHFPPLKPDGTLDNYKPERERPSLPTLENAVPVADYELVCAAKADKQIISVNTSPH